MAYFSADLNLFMLVLSVDGDGACKYGSLEKVDLELAFPL